jgi:hypothetical protein
MRSAVKVSIILALFAISPVAFASKCFSGLQGFYLQAEVSPGLKGTSYFLHVNCSGRAALTVKPFGQKAVRKEWSYSFQQIRSIVDAINTSAFYDLPPEIGESLPVPDSGAYMLNAHRELERHRVVYNLGLDFSSPEKSRFVLVWNAVFAPSGVLPPVR